MNSKQIIRGLFNVLGFSLSDTSNCFLFLLPLWVPNVIFIWCYVAESSVISFLLWKEKFISGQINFSPSRKSRTALESGNMQ